jgi:hypothetical protein
MDFTRTEWIFSLSERRETLAKKIIDAIRDKALLERSRKRNYSLIEEKVLCSVNTGVKVMEDVGIGSIGGAGLW